MATRFLRFRNVVAILTFGAAFLLLLWLWPPTPFDGATAGVAYASDDDKAVVRDENDEDDDDADADDDSGDGGDGGSREKSGEPRSHEAAQAQDVDDDRASNEPDQPGVQGQSEQGKKEQPQAGPREASDQPAAAADVTTNDTTHDGTTAETNGGATTDETLRAQGTGATTGDGTTVGTEGGATTGDTATVLGDQTEQTTATEGPAVGPTTATTEGPAVGPTTATTEVLGANQNAPAGAGPQGAQVLGVRLTAAANLSGAQLPATGGEAAQALAAAGMFLVLGGALRTSGRRRLTKKGRRTRR